VSVEYEIKGIIGSIKKLAREVRNDDSYPSEYQEWIDGILDSAIAVLEVAQEKK
jgi:hypothetical protein